MSSERYRMIYRFYEMYIKVEDNDEDDGYFGDMPDLDYRLSGDADDENEASADPFNMMSMIQPDMDLLFGDIVPDAKEIDQREASKHFDDPVGSVFELEKNKYRILFLVMNSTEGEYFCCKASQFYEFASEDDIVLETSVWLVLFEPGNRFYLGKQDLEQAMYIASISEADFRLLENPRVFHGLIPVKKRDKVLDEYIRKFHIQEFIITHPLRSAKKPRTVCLHIPKLEGRFRTGKGALAASSARSLSAGFGIEMPEYLSKKNQHPMLDYDIIIKGKGNAWLIPGSALTGKTGTIHSQDLLIYAGKIPKGLFLGEVAIDPETLARELEIKITLEEQKRR